MRIAIEGMDGVGKSTVSKLFAERNNYTYIGDAIHQLFGIKGKKDKNYEFFQNAENEIFLNSDNFIIKAWLCSLGNIYTATCLKEENIIVDRHILSNFLQNGTKENFEMYEALVKLIGVPDKTVILYASPKTRLQRIRERNPYDMDLENEEIFKDKYPRMRKFAEMFNIPYLYIDTEGKTVNQVVEEIENRIKEQEKSKGLDNKESFEL